MGCCRRVMALVCGFRRSCSFSSHTWTHKHNNRWAQIHLSHIWTNKPNYMWAQINLQQTWTHKPKNRWAQIHLSHTWTHKHDYRWAQIHLSHTWTHKHAYRWAQIHLSHTWTQKHDYRWAQIHLFLSIIKLLCQYFLYDIILGLLFFKYIRNGFSCTKHFVRSPCLSRQAYSVIHHHNIIIIPTYIRNCSLLITSRFTLLLF